MQVRHPPRHRCPPPPPQVAVRFRKQTVVTRSSRMQVRLPEACWTAWSSARAMPTRPCQEPPGGGVGEESRREHSRVGQRGQGC
eukprot:10398732-Alexandrium_andersonii.AAC.1